MTINHTHKIITANTWELPQVSNYLNHCVAPADRKNWKVNILEASNIEYRTEKN